MEFIRRWKERRALERFAIQHIHNPDNWWAGDAYGYDEEKYRKRYTREMKKDISLPVWGKWVKIS
jgi:hypothetical protein